MTKEKRNILIAVIIGLAILVVVPLGLYMTGNLYFSEVRNYEAMWDIAIPEEAESIYGAKSHADFHGDGAKYTMFHFDGNDTKFLSDFSSDKNTDMEEAVGAVLEQLKVSQENRPDFTQDYVWKQLKSNGDRLFIIYISSAERMYFIQETT